MEPAKYRFYQAGESDVPQISDLLGSVWAKYFSYYVSPEELQIYLTDKVGPETMLKEMRDPNQYFIAATTASSPEVIVGVAQITLGSKTPSVTAPNAIELQRIYIDGDHHGTGLAQTLMQRAEDFIRSKGGESVWLGVWEHNEKGMAFYRKCGFERVGEKGYYLGTTRRTDYVYLKNLA